MALWTGPVFLTLTVMGSEIDLERSGPRKGGLGRGEAKIFNPKKPPSFSIREGSRGPIGKACFGALGFFLINKF
jgi:hypothetical protein